MNTSIWLTFNRYLRNARQWYESTPERSLDQAYDAALMIRAIEDQHFDGQPVSNSSGRYSDNSYTVLAQEFRKYLKIARLRLSEFNVSRSFFNTTNSATANIATARSNSYVFANGEQDSVTLEKLKFIDEVLARYQPPKQETLSLVPVSQTGKLPATNQNQSNIPTNPKTGEPYPLAIIPEEGEGMLDKTGVLPRSLAGTLNRIRRELDPESEKRVVQNFRSAKAKTLISIRFILILIIAPLLTQQLSKSLLVGPIVDHFRSPNDTEIFINFELEEEALTELRIFEERLRFDNLLGKAPELSAADALEREQKITEKLREKAQEIAAIYRNQSANAVKNVFADLLSLAAFAIVIMTNQREIAVLKSFIDETVYGLSDSAKAFIIILFTDVFVGFHSPHGWEVLLEGVSRHLGIAANRDFIFLFIATFPVILDTIFKYWIFRYLNRISPSAVATYRNMNE